MNSIITAVGSYAPVNQFSSNEIEEKITKNSSFQNFTYGILEYMT